MITAQSMRPIKDIGPGQLDNLMAKMRTARKCTEIILITLGAIMMSAVLHAYPKQDSYVNLKVEEVIDPLFTLHETENNNRSIVLWPSPSLETQLHRGRRLKKLHNIV